MAKNDVGGIQEFYNSVLWNSTANYFTPRNKFKMSWTYSDSNDLYSSSMCAMISLFNLYSDSIDLPDTVIKGGVVIDNGRGSYYTNSDQLTTPDGNELTINYRDSQISASEIVNNWMVLNSIPFVRPMLLNLKIDYISDFDGKSIVMSYTANGCRPISIKTIKATHEGKEINIRAIKFGFHCLTPDYAVIQKSQEIALATAIGAQSKPEAKTASGYIKSIFSSDKK